jgi:hypothetical protein
MAGGRETGLAVSMAAALLCLAALRLSRRSRSAFVLETCLVTATLGGLGMQVGARLDAHQLGLNPSEMAPGEMAAMPSGHEHSGAHGLAALGTWMTGMMLLFCLPACLGLCRLRAGAGSLLHQGALHLVGALGMLGGMLAGGALLGAPLARLLGSAHLGGHLAMVAGMTAGSAATLAAVIPLSFFRRSLAGEPCQPAVRPDHGR